MGIQRRNVTTFSEVNLTRLKRLLAEKIVGMKSTGVITMLRVKKPPKEYKIPLNPLLGERIIVSHSEVYKSTGLSHGLRV